MQALIADSLAARRFIMSLLALTGCLALAMAAAGVYGVATYITSRRAQEIGVRIALGATRGDVEALIFRQGFLTAATGLAAGLAIALLLMRIMRRVLVGLDSGNLPPCLDRGGHRLADCCLRQLAPGAACSEN